MVNGQSYVRKYSMKEKNVSIIMPVYNKGKYIEATIRSVQEQTYENWELVIVDDCSSDDSAEIIKRCAVNDERIHYYQNEKNLGAAGSRNRAIELATGRYIAFLDSDDLWLPEKLEKQIEYMSKNDCAFCYSACNVIDTEGQHTGKVRLVPGKVDYKTLLKGNVIPCLTVVLDRTKVKNIRMKKMGHEDYVLWLDMLKQCGHAYGIEEVLGSYREYGNSLSSNKFTAAQWMWKIYREYENFGFFKSSWYFVNYAMRAVLKRI